MANELYDELDPTKKKSQPGVNPAAATNGSTNLADYGAATTNGSMDDQALRTALGGSNGAASTNSGSTGDLYNPGAADAKPAAGALVDGAPAMTNTYAPTPAAATPAATSSASTPDMSPAEAAAAGLGWVPRNHPLYGTPGFVGSQAGGGSAPGGGTPGAASPAGSNSIPGQAAAASTYSTTPGAAPTANTSNQGAQDVYRNSLLQRATQSTVVDTNDPTFRKTADTYAAAQERARRNANDMAAESAAGNGMGSSAQLDAEKRMSNEKSAQASAGFEGQLALSELQNKRSEIADALNGLGSTISGDQARALQEKLAQLDATIKRESLAQSGSLGSQDLSLRRDLGTGSLNLQGLGMLLNNQQNNNSLGAQIGFNNASLNQNALRTLLGL